MVDVNNIVAYLLTNFCFLCYFKFVPKSVMYPSGFRTKCLSSLRRILIFTIILKITIQPAPDVFYSFEDVIVMADGQIIYHGMFIDNSSFSFC